MCDRKCPLLTCIPSHRVHNRGGLIGSDLSVVARTADCDKLISIPDKAGVSWYSIPLDPRKHSAEHKVIGVTDLLCHGGIAVGDIDGDGDIDIFTKPWSGDLHLFVENLLIDRANPTPSRKD